MDYCKYIIFERMPTLTVNKKDGEKKVFTNFKDLAEDYKVGNIYPNEIKPAVTDALN